jgi:hypothetical protein
MSVPTNAAAMPVAPDDGIVRLLRLLARRGASAVLTAGGDAVVSAPGRAPATVPATALQQARAGGWVAISDGAVALTRTGRTSLRRILSTTEARETRNPASRSAAPPAAQAPSIDLQESPLAWLARRQRATGEPLISPAQLAAGERFRADFWFAGLSPRVTSSWSANGSASRTRKSGGYCAAEQTDAMIGARERVRRALEAVGPELSGILIDVCGHLKGLEQAERDAEWPKRTAKVVLDLALNALARHYGLIATAPRRAGRARHWGAPDYRPPAEVPVE